MKALLYKDVNVLWRQARILLLITLIFSLTPNMQFFTVIYAIVLAITSMGYDEQAHWNTLADMMPYKPRDIVLSKYALGLLATTVALLVVTLVNIGRSIFFQANLIEDIAIAIAYFSGAMIAMALLLPLVHRFGVEKARLLFVVIFLSFMLITFLLSGSVSFENRNTSAASDWFPLLLVVASTIVVNVISIKLSILGYLKRQRS